MGGGLRRLQDDLKTEERKKEDARGSMGKRGLARDRLFQICFYEYPCVPYNSLAFVRPLIEATSFDILRKASRARLRIVSKIGQQWKR